MFFDLACDPRPPSPVEKIRASEHPEILRLFPVRDVLEVSLPLEGLEVDEVIGGLCPQRGAEMLRRGEAGDGREDRRDCRRNGGGDGGL